MGSVGSTSPPTAVSVTLRDYVELLRPSQWVKNVVVFAGPAAGLALSSATSVLQASGAFIAFCLVASATYAINDVLDRKADASHPTKRTRPVARGAIRVPVALGIALVLVVVVAIGSTLLLNDRVTAVLAAYFIMTVVYSLALKKRIILDVIVVATGFVLRACAGGLAGGVVGCEWLVGWGG